MNEPLPSPVTDSPLDVLESARRVGAACWVEARAFEVLGGWVQVEPHLEAKLLFAALSQHHAWHAEVWAGRLAAVGPHTPAELTAPANEAVVAVALLAAGLDRPDQTPERLATVARVLLPGLLAGYQDHLARTTPVADATVARTLRIVISDEQADHRETEGLLATLVGGDPAAAERADRWASALTTDYPALW